MTDDADHRARAPRGQYAKSAEVQERIVLAATEVFATLGYHAATFKQVAAAAGMSERGVVYHFPTKEGLLIAVLDQHERVIGRSTAPIPSDGASMMASVLTNLANDARTPGLVELHCLLSAESIAPDHPAFERYRRRYELFRRYIAMGFERLGRDGELTSELPSHVLASGFIALMDGLQLQWVRDRSIEVRGTIEGYLQGLLTHDAYGRVTATPPAHAEDDEHVARSGA